MEIFIIIILAVALALLTTMGLWVVNRKGKAIDELQAEMAQAKTRLAVEVAQSERAEATTQELQDQRQQLTEQNLTLTAQVATLKERNEAVSQKLATQMEQMTELQNRAQLQFEKLANDILENKSAKFTQSNQVNIEAVLKPLGLSIESFKRRVEESLTEQTKQRSSLEAQVRELLEQTARVGVEANNLTRALKGNVKKMGNWGEMILESILQQSGLTKGREYELQATIIDPETQRQLRPDVLVHLPDNRTIIIDSKVSLIAYEGYCSSTTAEQAEAFLKEHLRSIYAHVDSLASKQYDNIATSLDFTMMFVPIEPAYMLAVQSDAELWSKAYAKRIMLISPTNLIACLRMMADLWKMEMQSKSAQEIVR
ncbi:MAG: DNA recombination protein RmuC, partial [Mucinivorans sp.]